MPPRALDRSTAWAVVAGGILAALTYCATSDPNGRWEELPPVGQPWSMAQLYGQDWDRVVIACPYDTPEQLTAELGSTWTGPDVSMSDDAQVVVLLRGGQVVSQDIAAPGLVGLCSDGLEHLTPYTVLVQDQADGVLRTRLATAAEALE